MKKNKGFTLVELLIVMAILALIVAYALPSYRNHVAKSKRVEAQNKLLETAGMLEKYYANNNTYPTSLRTGGARPLNLQNSFLQWEDYQVVASWGAGGGWTLRAVARGSQATYDTSCGTITLNNLGAKGPSKECWNK